MSDRPSTPPPDPAQPEIDALAAAILDGVRIDWRATGATVDAADADEFRVLEALAAVHRNPGVGRRPVDVDSGDAVPPLDAWGRLALLERIGQGSYGTVYRAWDAELQRSVALKLLPAPLREGASSSVLAEARLLARVRHPHVLTIHGAERIDGQVGIWTEFIDGRTLDAIVRDEGPLPPNEVVAIGCTLGGALAAVHAANLLHRDIKAQNVMREAGGRIVLMDFGAGHDLAQPARPGDLTGTPLYLAPEILNGGRASAASDVYSLSVLLFYLVTGHFPVSGRTFEEVQTAHQRGGADRQLLNDPHVPSPLARAIERGLAHDPSARYQTARAFEEALRAAERTIAARHGRVRSIWRTGHTWIFESKVHVVLAAAGVTVLVVAAVWASIGLRLGLTPVPHASQINRIPFPIVDPKNVGQPSPDLRFFPYVDRDRNIEVFEAATGVAHVVTTVGSPDEGARSSVMSPLGDRVAYDWTLPNGAFELRVVNVDGTWHHALVPRESAYEPIPEDWSKDGRSIACWFQQRNGSADLVLVPADGGSPRVLVTLEHYSARRANFSPDGRFIIYYNDAGCRAGSQPERCLFVIGTDGSAPRVLIHGTMTDGLPFWAPGGTGVFFVRINPDQSRDGFEVPVRNGFAVGPPRVIASDLAGVLHANLSDRGALAYFHDSVTRELYTATIDLVRGGLGAPTRLSLKNLSGTAMASWSPDGRQLAYFALPPGAPSNAHFSVLAILDAASGQSRQLQPKLSFVGSYAPAFIPGTNRVIVWGTDDASRDPKRFGYFAIDTQTNETTPVATVGAGGDPARFAASPDGRVLVYVDGRRGLVSHNLTTGREEVLLSNAAGEEFGTLAFSPSGRSVAVIGRQKRAQALVVLDVGNTRRQIFSSTTDYLDVVGWSPDGRNVIYARSALAGLNRVVPLNLWRVPSSGGPSEDLHAPVLTGRGGHIALSPDGRRIVYTEVGELNELWVRPNFFAVR